MDAVVTYPPFRGTAPLMSSGEIRDRVRFQLWEAARSSRGPLLRARPKGILAEQALKDPRVALAVAHGVQASFLGLALAAPAGSALERAGRSLGMQVLPAL